MQESEGSKNDKIVRVSVRRMKDWEIEKRETIVKVPEYNAEGFLVNNNIIKWMEW